MSYTPTVNARNNLAINALATLTSANYCVSSAYNCDNNKPMDVIVEIDVATTNTPAGNKQLIAFVKDSLDGTNYRSGPESGSTTTDEPDLKFLGVVPVNTANTTHIGMFSVLAALGYIPKNFKIVCKNDLGVALTSGSAYTSEISVP